jgi:hypothetical protein
MIRFNIQESQIHSRCALRPHHLFFHSDHRVEDHFGEVTDMVLSRSKNGMNFSHAFRSFLEP